jgi:F-type H+-transporting ATPase subunit b
MEIDWLTVAAQIVNFLILVYLLKRFLYQPVMTAMARREQGIAERLEEAWQREQKAEEKARSFEEKSAELERRRQELIAQAREDAEKERNQWLDQARAELAEQRETWRSDLEREKQDFLKALQRQVADVIQAVARKCLTELADAELEQQMVRSFLARLQSLDEEDRRALAVSAGNMQILTAFPLPDELCGRVEEALHRQIGEHIATRFSLSADLVCGIVLKTEEQELGWNIADYLQALARRIDEALIPTQRAKD